jgi:hypothetical protein
VQVYISIYFCPAVILKQLTFVAAWAIASRVIGLSVVVSKSSDAEKGKLFSSGPMAAGHLPAVQSHTRMDKCNLSITSVMQGLFGASLSNIVLYPGLLMGGLEGPGYEVNAERPLSEQAIA